MISKQMVAWGESGSSIREIAAYGERRAAEIGPENVYNFAIGNPSIDPPDCVQEAVERLLHTVPPTQLHAYAPAPGMASVREKVAAYLTDTFGEVYRAQDIYMTDGASSALAILTRALMGPGDEAIVFAPYFPEYAVYAEAAGGSVRVVPCRADTFALDLDALAAAVTEKTALLILNSPNNPSGVVVSRPELEALAALLREKQARYGHRIYIIALIDDASRFITGIDVFYHDNFINLMSVMKSAIAKYGRPKVFNFDNGKSYKNRQMELLAARIGTTLSYCQPYTPTGKAKIERWFRTMKDQWMAALDMRDFHSLEELRGSLYAFVQQYNQSPHSSLHGLSPQDRFFSEPEQIRRLSEEDIHQNFLLEIERRVSADSVIVIDQIEYEVDYRFARQRIRLRYSPDMKEIFIVEADGTLTPLRLLNKTENALIKREKVRLCKGDE